MRTIGFLTNIGVVADTKIKTLDLSWTNLTWYIDYDLANCVLNLEEVVMEGVICDPHFIEALLTQLDQRPEFSYKLRYLNMKEVVAFYAIAPQYRNLIENVKYKLDYFDNSYFVT